MQPQVDQFVVPLFAGASILLLVVAYFTRPTPRRLVAAVAGGLAFGTLNIVWDVGAYYAGWWYYPWTDAPYAPLPFYLIQALSYGAAVTALVGWRIIRRFGTRGLVGFLVLFPIYGAIHDYGGTAAVASSGMLSTTIVFAPGLAALLADALCYETMALAALIVMRLIAGPANADRLARSPAHQLA